MSRDDTTTDWTKSVNVRLSNGEYLPWGEGTPEQFRRVISAKAAMRLVKIAESVQLYNPTMDFVKVQKGDMLDTLKGVHDMLNMPNIACEFDGSTLLILGTV